MLLLHETLHVIKCVAEMRQEHTYYFRDCIYKQHKQWPLAQLLNHTGFHSLK